MDCVRDGDLAVISAPIDALGVNYYTPTRLSALPRLAAALPDGIHPRLSRHGVRLAGHPGRADRAADDAGEARYGGLLPPVYITENGCSVADEPDADGSIDDQPRIAYLDGHIRAVADAITAGVDVRGYLVWSLLDNFEWAEGYHQRFGLVHVDFATQRRTPKASFAWYRDLIAAQPSSRQAPGACCVASCRRSAPRS